MLNQLLKKNRICIYFICLVFMSFGLISCKEDNRVEPVEKKAIVGTFKWSEWQEKAGWASYDAADYIPDDSVMSELKAVNKDNISYILFSASWCPDCMKEMPQLMKIFKLMDLDLETITIYGLTYKEKTEPTGTYLKYDIKRVPTLVVLKDGEEIGRIVEYPVESLEKDLLKILSL